MTTSNIIKNPRITEKASVLAEQNVYVFDVLKSANKTEVKKAIIEIYKVHPVKVNISSVPIKQVLTRGKVGKRGGGKKAVVFLKKGDKIELI
jgi:large subunit ribosomal protein L23